ncbi:hypothetical protein JIN84_07605 [Luteolibacter yonseiensis]|uniref:Uncharacterized protein n=1 Tax=Luteolibacter yonseiensis TaxID=1144680 RepID=A0A934R275_9BACT|nr:hypothetical protein [Luteolibacter yonseiensis]MBK1815474.1 hypothetical protein [Luteolibacter yonseiensis]
MNERGFSTLLRPGGILRWSTACILAGTLSSCERSYVATEKDVEMADIQARIEKLDGIKSSLTSGEVTNNFHIPGVGYYHAEIGRFLEHPYGFVKDGLHYINGEWEYFARESTVAASHPTAKALRQVEMALEEEQKNTALPQNQHQGGLGMGNALMMYWLLSGNRGAYTSGSGFQQARQNVSGWQQDVEKKREETRTYAAMNPGYGRVVEKAKAGGTTVKVGQSVRGGFGSSSSRSGGFSYGG